MYRAFVAAGAAYNSLNLSLLHYITLGSFVFELLLLLLLFFIKNEKIKVTLCKNAAEALYIVNKMCVDGQRKVEGETSGDSPLSQMAAVAM